MSAMLTDKLDVHVDKVCRVCPITFPIQQYIYMYITVFTWGNLLFSYKGLTIAPTPLFILVGLYNKWSYEFINASGVTCTSYY